MTSDEEEYGLVMPYVVCQSRGGPYDDVAFVAGVRFGTIDAELRAGTTAYSSFEPTDLVPQIDLLAMHYGYDLRSTPWDEAPDEWSLVTLTRTNDDR